MNAQEKPTGTSTLTAMDIAAVSQQLQAISAELPTLAKQDASLDQRQGHIRQQQQEYVFDYTQIAGIAMLKDLPEQEYPSFQWITQVGETMLSVIWNKELAQIEFQSREWFDFFERDFQKNMTFLKNKAKDVMHHVMHDFFGDGQDKDEISSSAKQYHEIKRMFEGWKPHETNSLDGIFEAFSALVPKMAFDTHVRARKLGDYSSLFKGISLPAVASRFQSDAMFGFYRVAGPNPMSIRIAPENWQDLVPLNESTLRQVQGYEDVSLEQAFSEQRLYLLQYEYLDQLEPSSYPVGQKYMSDTRGVFYKNDFGHLMPIAIRCDADGVVLTPKNGYAWSMAKNMVQVADANYHELVAHLGRTHLVAEAILISSHRQFATSHPIFKLLAPHFEGTAFINWAAKKFLVARGNFVDKLLAGTIESAHKVVATAVSDFEFNKAMPDQDFDTRGVNNKDLLYPYRDDALMVWDAITSWVVAYVDVFYSDDQAVQEDQEVQAFAKDVVSENGGRISDFGEGQGAIVTKAYFVRALSMVIFTASAQHAAVNFTQSADMSYLPSMPLSSYGPAPKGPDHNRADWLAQYAPLDMASQQVAILHTLGSVQYTTLGQYGHHYFKDDRVAPLVENFQQHLAGIQQRIAIRNAELVQQGLLPYEFLSPERIPQSINI